MTAPASPLLTVPQAAAYLKKSREWLYRHADQIGCVRDGGPLRFRQARLDQWISAHETRPSSVREVPRAKALAVVVDAQEVNPFTGERFGVGR
jgi:excisionase family DNA binding protein